MALNIKLLLDTRRTKRDGTYPLIMRILYQRKSINISLGYCLQEKDWDKKKGKVKPTAQLGENVTRLNNYIHKERTRAYDIITKLQDEGLLQQLTLIKIKQHVLNKGHKKLDKQQFFPFIDELIGDLLKGKKYGNASVYKTLKGRLRKFVQDEKLTFEEITPKFLQKFEVYHYSNGSSTGSLSVYLRTLRAVFNKAINTNLVSKEFYPFSQYKIKNNKPQRKVLSQEDFQRLKAISFPDNSALYHAKNLFMTSFV